MTYRLVGDGKPAETVARTLPTLGRLMSDDHVLITHLTLVIMWPVVVALSLRKVRTEY